MKKLFILVAILALLAMVGNALAQETSSDLFQKALAKEKAEGNLEEAIVLFQKVVDLGEDEALAAQAQLHIGMCYEKLGLGKAREAYQKVLDRFPNQEEVVRAAREKLGRLQKGLPAEKTEDKRLQIKLVASNFGSRFGMVSPDGKSIAIKDSQSGNLAIRDIETGQVRRVTNESNLGALETFILGRWSPDGKKIAYAWFNKDNYPELRLIGTDGSEPRVLFRDRDCQILPNGWSPDGRFILASVLRKALEYQIVLVSTGDGSVQILKTSTIQNASELVIGFSPDGQYIAYDAPQKENAKENDIFLLSRDGKQEIRLVEHPAQDKFLAWVPNSNILLFSSNRALSMDVWMLHVAEGRALGEPVLVKKDIGDIQPLGITNNGTLFYGAGTYMVDLYEAGVDLDKGVVVDPPKKLNQDFLSPIYSPKWSPDGKSLAYLVEKREAGKPSAFFICVRTENKEERLIPVPMKWGRSIDWSADGRSFFATGQDLNLPQGLFRIDPLTGSPALLSRVGPYSWIVVFAVAPDGKSIFYVSFQLQNKLSLIIEHDLATGQDREVYRKASPPSIGDLIVSPDSQSLSFTTSDKPMGSGGLVIRFLSLADGKTRDILHGKIDQYRPQVWSWDGKSLVYAMSPAGSKGGKAELWRVPAAGGEPTIIDLGLELKGDADLSPDGKRLVYSSGKIALEIWAMENFLPKNEGDNK